MWRLIERSDWFKLATRLYTYENGATVIIGDLHTMGKDNNHYGTNNE